MFEKTKCTFRRTCSKIKIYQTKIVLFFTVSGMKQDAKAISNPESQNRGMMEQRSDRKSPQILKDRTVENHPK